MHHLLYFSLLCIAIGLAVARQNKEKPHVNKNDQSSSDDTYSKPSQKHLKFCSNKKIAQKFLTLLLSILNTLEANSTYNSILQLQWINFVSYLKNGTNQSLLDSDCEAFVKGLLAAKAIDKSIQREQRRVAISIQKQIQQAARNATNGKGFYDLKF